MQPSVISTDSKSGQSKACESTLKGVMGSSKSEGECTSLASKTQKSDAQLEREAYAILDLRGEHISREALEAEIWNMKNKVPFRKGPYGMKRALRRLKP